MKISSLLLVTVALIAGCKDSGTSVKSTVPTPGTYLYKAFDPGNHVVVTGLLTLAIDDKGAVTGEWTFEKKGSFDKTGPQVGTGTLEGSVENNELQINLNPGWADNNVFLSGELKGGAWTGKWRWVTFVGPTSEGTFEATPR